MSFGRIGAAVVVAASLLVGFAGVASASATFDTEVHVRACGPGAVDLWEDCHGNPVEGYAFGGWYLDDPSNFVETETDADGNAYFSVSSVGVTYGEVFYDGAGILSIYCSAENGNITVDYNDDYTDFFYVDNDIDTLVVCDIYVFDENAGSGDGAALPDTGTGPMSQGANLGLLLAGVVALGGLAVASRRAAVR